MLFSKTLNVFLLIRLHVYFDVQLDVHLHLNVKWPSHDHQIVILPYPDWLIFQAEDRERRPSIIMYQSEANEHPDVIALQKLVDSLNFTSQE